MIPCCFEAQKKFWAEKCHCVLNTSLPTDLIVLTENVGTCCNNNLREQKYSNCMVSAWHIATHHLQIYQKICENLEYSRINLRKWPETRGTWLKIILHVITSSIDTDVFIRNKVQLSNQHQRISMESSQKHRIKSRASKRSSIFGWNLGNY